jgi:HSP20 family protein
MDPFDEDRRRRKSPFDSIDDFDRIFDEMEKMFESTNFREWVKEILHDSSGPNKRFIHRLGIDIVSVGKPRVQRFCNCPFKNPKVEPMSYKEPEPLTDIIEGDEEVAVTVEITGVEKEDIDFNVTEDTIEITACGPEREYHELIDLPCVIKPKTMKVTYKNGVLDVVVKRKEKKKTGRGYRVAID